MLSGVVAFVGFCGGFIVENGIYALVQVTIVLLLNMLSFIPSLLHCVFRITLGGINALQDYVSVIQTFLSWPVIVFDIFARFPILLLPVIYCVARRYPKRELAKAVFKATTRAALFVLDLFLRGVSLALEQLERKLILKSKKMEMPN